MAAMEGRASSTRKGTGKAGTVLALVSLLPLLVLQMPGGFALLLHEHDDYHHAHVLPAAQVALAMAGDSLWHETRYAGAAPRSTGERPDRIRFDLDGSRPTVIVFAFADVAARDNARHAGGPSLHRHALWTGAPCSGDAWRDGMPAPPILRCGSHVHAPVGRTGAWATLLRNHALLL